MYRSLLAFALLIGCKDKEASDSAALDADGDGYTMADDCDDADSAIHPGADEVDDDIDNDCDGVADEYLSFFDGDGDGYSAQAGDCDDADPAVGPGADETDADGIDNDCDGIIDETPEQEDDDGDGWTEVEGDCDDADPDISPDASELEDRIDNDCDGVTDDGTRLYDDDGDGYPETFGDCDDDDPAAYPGAEDAWYDDVDSDCEGNNDFDADGDGYASDAWDGPDCDDADPEIGPSASETCDGVDQNCDGQVDEGLIGLDETCPGPSCLLIGTSTGADDGLYWVDPLGTGAREVWCDMSGGGWTLVARATNAGGLSENASLSDGEETGTLPILPDSEGNDKLSDDLINALRTGTMPNDLKVVVIVDGAVLGESWHPQDCALHTGMLVDPTDPCGASTTGGPDDLDYANTTLSASLSRWGVDGELGYVWGAPGVYLGPIEGGVDAEGDLPDPYCSWLDEESCPVATAIEIWAL